MNPFLRAVIARREKMHDEARVEGEHMNETERERFKEEGEVLGELERLTRERDALLADRATQEQECIAHQAKVEKERDALAAQLAQTRATLRSTHTRHCVDRGIFRGVHAPDCLWRPDEDPSDALSTPAPRDEGFDPTATALENMTVTAPRLLSVEQAREVVARVFDRTTTAYPLKTTVATVIDEVLNGR